MEIEALLNRDIPCSCGRTHRCDIEQVLIGDRALEKLSEALGKYRHVLLVADENTYPLCGERVCALLGDRVEGVCMMKSGEEGLVVPDEESILYIEQRLSAKTELILGIGSGVINDLCKYVSYFHGLKCGIVATAPSMDGFASSGAAMIIKGMKVTYTTHAPCLILGDVELLRNAPMDMIRSGYADIIGKYSALCDWRLSALVNREYICPEVYDLVKKKTDLIRSLAKDILDRKPEAIRELMSDLVLIGVTLTLLSTTRPGSGSEHHLSHYFEITGLLRKEPYFLHGTDVGYATVVTAGLRERLRKMDKFSAVSLSDETREQCYRAVYGTLAEEVSLLQREAGRYETDSKEKVHRIYETHWKEIVQILAECPTAAEIETMLTDCGFDMTLFEKQYGRKKIEEGILLAKDLKDRYSVLWLYCSMFFDEEEAKRIL